MYVLYDLMNAHIYYFVEKYTVSLNQQKNKTLFINYVKVILVLLTETTTFRVIRPSI